MLSYLLDSVVFIDGAAAVIATALFFSHLFEWFTLETRGVMEQRAREQAEHNQQLMAAEAPLQAAINATMYGVTLTIDSMYGHMQAKREQAENKAMLLLGEWLTEAQRRQMAKHNAFLVRGSKGRLYIICPRPNYGVIVLDKHNAPVQRLCFEPETASAYGDKMLAQKIALETDEAKVWTIANKTGYVHSDIEPAPSYADLTAA